MSRLAIIVVVSLAIFALTTRVAAADSFGGWQYTAPAGYSAEDHAGYRSLTKHTESGFCSIALFETRSLVKSVRVESALEWYDIVAASFNAKVQRRATSRTTDGVTIAMTTASITDGAGTYASVHYVVTPPDLIGSVLLIAGPPAMLGACTSVATPFVRGLVIDTARFTDPEARVETLQGRWAAAGATSREYTFDAAGTYRFRSESANRVVEESGTYTLRGYRLVLAPRTNATATVDAGGARWSRGKLETAAYTWYKRYSPETNSWLIIMTPLKATMRDGTLRGAESYKYSDTVKPAWKLFAAQPGA
jgi:hypothetical protein